VRPSYSTVELHCIRDTRNSQRVTVPTVDCGRPGPGSLTVFVDSDTYCTTFSAVVSFLSIACTVLYSGI